MGQHLFGCLRGGIAEHMRMPADNLVPDPRENLLQRECARFFADASSVKNVEEQVAEFLRDIFRSFGLLPLSPCLNRVDDLPGLLENVLAHVGESLLAVPRAPARIAQAFHDRNEFDKNLVGLHPAIVIGSEDFLLAPLLLASLFAAPGLAFPSGDPIRLDGEITKNEWKGAHVVQQADSKDEGIRVLFRRYLGHLAIGIEGKGPYRGEVLRVRLTANSGAWVTELMFGLGQPAMPPLLWRRGPAERLRAADPSAGFEAPRGARVRVRAENSEGWSAEILVRMGTLGIGRGDLRSFRGLITVTRFLPKRKVVCSYPAGLTEPYQVTGYAPIAGSGWGATENWPPVSPEASREYDDHALLYRLHREHEGYSRRQRAVDVLVIADATNPRAMVKINALREQIEAGRRRNPTLPAWRYFLGRLLNEANLYPEARELIDGIPKPLRPLDPFVNLAGEHYLATQAFDKALEAVRGKDYVRRIQETASAILKAKDLWAAEQKRLAKDEEKVDKLPRVKLVTQRGEIIIELFEDDAPFAVYNFLSLILKRKYYDRQRFHAVGGGSFVTFGDPRTRPGSSAKSNGPAWRLRRDNSPRPFLRGYLATVPIPNGSACHGSQVAFTVAPRLRATQRVDVFGRVIKGLAILESIEQDDALLRVEVLHRRNHPYDAIKARIQR